MKQAVLAFALCCFSLLAAATTYPYSIVPGGVASDRDVRQARAQSALTDAHYTGIGPLAPTAVVFPTVAYVSSLKEGRIHWSKLTLAAGEPLLTDGTHLIRARCGNRITFTEPPPGAVIPPEESTVVLPEVPWTAPPAVAPPEPAPWITPEAPPGTVAPPLYGGLTTPWFGFPLPGGGGGGIGWPECVDKHGKLVPCEHHHRPVTPEPATWLTLGTGLLILRRMIKA